MYITRPYYDSWASGEIYTHTFNTVVQFTISLFILLILLLSFYGSFYCHFTAHSTVILLLILWLIINFLQIVNNIL